jgi:endonuclease YncB( thermonuclease family)
VTSPRRLLALALLAAPLAALAAPNRFADDYAGALAAARARKVPIFVDAWAPW